MSTTARNHLLRNVQVRGQVYPSATTAPQVTSTQLNQVMSDLELPPITTWDAQAIDQTGTSRRFIPSDIVLMLPAPGASALGATLWGTTAESQEPGYGIGPADHPGMVVAAYKQSMTPVRVYTIGAALGLPILANPDLSLKADVL